MVTPTVICDICKKPSTIIACDIRKEPALFGSHRVTLTLFKCPECKAEYVVQLDDEHTIGLMAEYAASVAGNASYKGHSKKFKDRMDRLSKEVDQLRKDLYEKYNGQQYRSVALDMKTLTMHIIAQIY